MPAHPREMCICALAAAAVVATLTHPAAGQQFVEATATRFPSPNPSEYTNQLTIGDLDNDGDLDIIFANGGDYDQAGTPQRQRIYINDGGGTFTDETNRLNFAGLCRGVELGDIDNDGDLDVILAQDFDRLPGLFVNDGSGVFTDVSAAQLPPITLSCSRAQFGDIDNDGDLDLYLTSGTSSRFSCGQYRVYVNDGSGFFSDETATRHPIGNVCNNMDCIFGDIDGDFDLDVRTASTGSNNSRLYRNDGTGVFSLVAGVPADSSCYSYDFGDMDGDGDLDMVGANGGTGTAEILLANDGAGGFADVSGQISPNLSLDDNDSKFFDYDDDGDLDLIIARLGSGGERIYNNDGHGNFTQASGVIQVVSDSTLDLMVADLDNDGDLDIVTAQGESGSFQNRIYINTTGPADTHPPRVTDTEQLPDTDDTAGPYVVRALILDDMTSDRNFFDGGIVLNYTVNAGLAVQVLMRHSGGQVYRGEIPGQPPGSTVDYFVTAFDWAGNEGAGAPRSFHVGGVFGDLDGDDIVGVSDFLLLLASWGPCPDPCPPFCVGDLDGDCSVGVTDFLLLLANWT
jgi:hypothetical protein